MTDDALFSHEKMREAEQAVRPIAVQFMKHETTGNGPIVAETPEGEALLSRAHNVLMGIGYSQPDAHQIFSDAIYELNQQNKSGGRKR